MSANLFGGEATGRGVGSKNPLKETDCLLRDLKTNDLAKTVERLNNDDVHYAREIIGKHV
jgi:hypothetical protein